MYRRVNGQRYLNGTIIHCYPAGCDLGAAKLQQPHREKRVY